jgi:hypothetical protein
MRGTLGVLLTVLTAWSATPLAAQPAPSDAPRWAVTAVGGGSFYCIVTRCNTGLLAGTTIGRQTTPNLSLELSARWHRCFDCHRFLIADAGLRLHRARHRIDPFVVLGGGVASDPEFFGTQFSPWIAAGTALHLQPRWSLQVEARGRRIRTGSSMGEFTAGLTHRL